MENSVLGLINKPEDLKKLSIKELKKLSSEIRKQIIEVVNTNGGHLASNLGVIELTIALHRVFDSPVDKIIWDVGHQCYTHKILTGRKEQFYTLRQAGGISGFPKTAESEHDSFDTGHASTSVSAGLGMLTGLKMQNISGKVVAVIGDSSLTGGMAIEALNHAGHIREELIVVLNDNNMAIDASVGGLSRSLSRLTTTFVYQHFEKNFDSLVRKLPLFGKYIDKFIARAKKGVKAVFFKKNIFSEFGIEYVGPIDGHNIAQLMKVFKNVKKISKPVVVHVSTIKGKGCDNAEGNPTLYHGLSPFSVVDGAVEKKSKITYTEFFSTILVDRAQKNEKIVAITAAMTEGTGLAAFSQRFPKRFFDVAIAEQHAVTFAAGLAISGLKPVVAIYSTFMQRAIDQVIHDVAIQSLPVVIIMDRAGLVPNDGETHQGIFDISIFRSIPNIEFLSPFDQSDVELMLDYALKSDKPVLLRFPKDIVPENVGEKKAVKKGHGRFLFKNASDTLIIGYGGVLSNILEAGSLLIRNGVKNDIYDLRFIKPLDEKHLCEVISGYKKVYLFEDSVVSNGMGEYIASILYTNKINVDFYFIGIKDYFPDHASRKELMAKNSLDAKSIFSYIKEKNDSGKI
ncbi:MAG: 1-deoxy-D-xylulose-5-phosphate synthase [Spirochaetaceae bacterium]|nr:1-deoxy-D-xylulose-5-phosphate synthase [Spirochaetaceae bacterium]